MRPLSSVTEIADHRPHRTEMQRCHSCGNRQLSVHLASVKREWWVCEKCGETACKAQSETAETKESQS